MARNARFGYWPLFALAVLFWTIVSWLTPPNFSGGDVALFRDPGANLVLEHRFEVPGLRYAGDLEPRLFAHYTPIVPLSYGLFAWAFGVGPRSGTFFFLLINVGLTALTFYFLDKAGIRSGVVLAIRVLLVMLLPVLFSEPDRPEAAGLVLLMLTAMASVRERRGDWVVCGALVAATFLAHPYAGILAVFWVISAYGLQTRLESMRWTRAGLELAGCGGVAALLVGAVAVVFYWLDTTSLGRFLGHSFGSRSGLGVLKTERHGTAAGTLGHTWALLRHTITPHNPLYFTALGLLVLIALIGWRLVRTREPVERWVAGSSLVMLVSAPALFPNQGQYLAVPALFVAIVTLAVGMKVHSPELARRACLYLAIVLMSRVPMFFYYMLPRVESSATYAEAERQPGELLARLPSREATVAILGGSYDLFKAKIPHLVGVQYFVPGEDLSQVQAVAFCPTAAPELSERGIDDWSVLERSGFELMERAPVRSRLTVFGHAVGQSYWGWGCNLYVRRGLGR